MTVAVRPSRTVAIVGGGFSGAAVAYHLAASGADARILLFEPRALLGAGLAYGGADPSWRINVPATRMSLLPDDETQFARWFAHSGELAADPEALCGDEAFPRRAAFGRYVDEAVRPLVAAGRIVHVRDRVVAAARSARGWTLRIERGEAFEADFLVIATTHPSPTLPSPLRPFRGDPRLVADGLADDALDAIPADERLLIVGSGLTAADIVCSLDRRGHRGKIVMASRRGLRPRGHATPSLAPEGDFVTRPARSATQLLVDIRRAVAKAERHGGTWRPVLDAVRAQGQEIWAALDVAARRRIVRRLRPYWDVHRFRAAPQVDAVLDRKFADGSLELLKAGLGAVDRTRTGFAVELVDRRRNAAVTQAFERVIVATGPSHRDILEAQPYLNELSQAGAVCLDSVGLGLATTADGRAIGAGGGPEATVYVAGPLARGAIGELMGLPQVSAHARFIAGQLIRALADPRVDPLAPAADATFAASRS